MGEKNQWNERVGGANMFVSVRFVSAGSLELLFFILEIHCQSSGHVRHYFVKRPSPVHHNTNYVDRSVENW